MREIYGNAWDLLESGEYSTLCITTNGAVNRFGECVMGRGIAQQFKRRYPFAPKILGDKIKEYGNIFQSIMWNEEVTFFAFPVKHIWNQKADLNLIRKSCYGLREYALLNKDKKILLPRPGCGNGQLDWKEVSFFISDILPDNVYIVHFENLTN